MALDREQYINSVNLNIDTDFPYLVLDVINDDSFPRNPGFHVMHWHEDLQFILVLDGTIEVQTLDSSSVFPTAPRSPSPRAHKKAPHPAREGALPNIAYSSTISATGAFSRTEAMPFSQLSLAA